MAISQLNARLAKDRRRASDPHFVSDEVERRRELIGLEVVPTGWRNWRESRGAACCCSCSFVIFSSESVGEGHPDKVCDTISDAVLDAYIAQDPRSRVACETYAKSNMVVVGGEITSKGAVHINELVREAIRGIGYVHDDDVFHADKVFITNLVTRQSPDIAQGVDARAAEGKETAEQGAGDQGLMFGYACDETPELMPAPIMFAHRLGRELNRVRKSGRVAWLRPDSKTQVSVKYENGRPARVVNVVVSTQHSRRRQAQGNQEFHHPGSHPQGSAGGHARQEHQVPHQPHRAVRGRRAAGGHGPDRAEDYR